MSHKRKGIRQACVASLTGATSAGSNVFSNRAAPLFGFDLPAINVTTIEEDASATYVTDTPCERNLTLAIDIYIDASATLDDDLDDLGKEVEDILAVISALGDDVVDARINSMAMALANVGQDKTAGVQRLVYSVTYFA